MQYDPHHACSPISFFFSNRCIAHRLYFFKSPGQTRMRVGSHESEFFQLSSTNITSCQTRARVFSSSYVWLGFGTFKAPTKLELFTRMQSSTENNFCVRLIINYIKFTMFNADWHSERILICTTGRSSKTRFITEQQSSRAQKEFPSDRACRHNLAQKVLARASLH